jgi:hypothetical protein
MPFLTADDPSVALPTSTHIKPMSIKDIHFYLFSLSTMFTTISTDEVLAKASVSTGFLVELPPSRN